MLALLAGVVSALIFFTVPERPAEAAHHTLAEQWHDVGNIFASRVFWRFAPQMGLFAGGFMALQGLWIVPWLINVNDVSRTVAADSAS